MNHQFELTANCSLSAREARNFFALVALGSLSVAAVFVVQGYWPILPFAGLELGVLAWALNRHWQRAQHWESLEINDAEVTIRRFDADGEILEQVSLPTLWTRTLLIRRGNRLDLGLRRGKQQHLIGSFLVDSEKRALEARLRQVLRQSGYNREMDSNG